jgi:hypothetical protein
MAPKTGRVFDAETFLNSSGLARRRAAYASAAVIFAQGTPADTVLYIQQGSVKLSVLSQAGKEARRSTLQRFRKTAGPHTAPARALRQAGRTPTCPAESIAGSARGNCGDDALAGELLHEQVQETRLHRLQQRRRQGSPRPPEHRPARSPGVGSLSSHPAVRVERERQDAAPRTKRIRRGTAAASPMVCNPRHRRSAQFRDTVVGALRACSS